MLTDPVEAFLSGFSSGIARILLALAAILGGFAVCAASSSWDTGSMWLLGVLGVGMVFWWGTYGGWFFLGLFSLISMFGFLWAFVHDRSAKFSFFALFTAAVVYASPLTFPDNRWSGALGIYLGAACCYWVVPYIAARLANWARTVRR